MQEREWVSKHGSGMERLREERGSALPATIGVATAMAVLVATLLSGAGQLAGEVLTGLRTPLDSVGGQPPGVPTLQTGAGTPSGSGQGGEQVPIPGTAPLVDGHRPAQDGSVDGDRDGEPGLTCQAIMPSCYPHLTMEEFLERYGDWWPPPGEAGEHVTPQVPDGTSGQGDPFADLREPPPSDLDREPRPVACTKAIPPTCYYPDGSVRQGPLPPGYPPGFRAQ